MWSYHVPTSRRFIPTGAGNTNGLYGLNDVVVGLSPLAREHTSSLPPPFYIIGLSLARGALILIGTQRQLGLSRWRGAQPGRAQPEFVPVAGLSPLARGTRQRHSHRKDFGLSPLAREHRAHGNARKRRFIPAGAGTRIHCRPQNIFGSVYPRWRGNTRGATE
ncbi:hypothetical protein KCP69_08055 [Salmonella enterica subsp. enterica]|nr:hypothetical protein KCP69_08055 [Salmonella enterica subsp. enterica]